MVQGGSHSLLADILASIIQRKTKLAKARSSPCSKFEEGCELVACIISNMNHGVCIL